MYSAISYEYFYGNEAEQFSFYRIPRLLITGQQFKNLSTDAKLLYGLMLDRMGISAKNGWYDEQGRVFIYYPVNEIEEDLNCGHNKAIRLVAELDRDGGIGLIERRRQGQGKPSIIYVKRFVKLIQDRDVRVLYTIGAKTAEKLHGVGIHTVSDIQAQEDDVIRLLGKQGQWITQLAKGIDRRKVVPYRPEDAKSIGRELTLQEDVSSYALLRDILLLLSISVHRRAGRVGLRGKGVTLKLTYANMKSITRSQLSEHCDSVMEIYETACRLLEQVEHQPVRLIGVSLYNLSAEAWRQLSMEDLLTDTSERQEEALQNVLRQLGERYRLDFAGNLDKLFRGETLYKTAEYMRKHA